MTMRLIAPGCVEKDQSVGACTSKMSSTSGRTACRILRIDKSVLTSSSVAFISLVVSSTFVKFPATRPMRSQHIPSFHSCPCDVLTIAKETLAHGRVCLAAAIDKGHLHYFLCDERNVTILIDGEQRPVTYTRSTRHIWKFFIGVL